MITSSKKQDDDQYRFIDHDYTLSGGVSMEREDFKHGFFCEHEDYFDENEKIEIFENIQRKCEHAKKLSFRIQKISPNSRCFHGRGHLHLYLHGKSLFIRGWFYSEWESDEFQKIIWSVPRVHSSHFKIFLKNETS